MTAAVLLAVLTACADGSDHPDAAPDPTSSAASPSTSPTTVDAVGVRHTTDLGHDRAARRALRAAFLELVAADTGSYSVSTDFGSAGSFDDSGHDELSTQSWDLSRRMDMGSEGTLDVRFVSRGDDSWIRLDGESAGARWPCWGPAQSLRTAALGAPTGKSPTPGAVIAASWATGRERTAGGFVGTTDLVTAVQLLSSKSIITGNLDPESTATVPADFTVTDGALTGMTIRLADLLTALRDEAVDLEIGAEEASSFPGQIDVTFAHLGEAVRVDAAPPADETLSSFDQSSFEQDMKACGRP